MTLLDHFRPPVTDNVPWVSFFSGWAYEMASLLNRVWYPQGYRAVPCWTKRATGPDDFEVKVLGGDAEEKLVGAVELVSPTNKDRPESGRNFASRCAAYLQKGVGLVVLDVVTIHQHNLHDELIQLLDQPESLRYPTESLLYATAYRPSGRGGRGRVEIWTFDLAIGQPLPTVPLPLRDGPTVPLDLQTTYQETRQNLFL